MFTPISSAINPKSPEKSRKVSVGFIGLLRVKRMAQKERIRIRGVSDKKSVLYAGIILPKNPTR